MGFSLKKLGRALDPTSKSAPLGGLVRAGISAIPGGGAALGAIDTTNALKKPAGGPGSSPVPSQPLPPAQVTSPATAGASWGTRLAGLSGQTPVLLVALAGLVVLFLFVRKR